MPPIEVRPFRRSDRDQVTELVNAHAGAVVPGMNASVSTVLTSLERQPGEFIADPWVNERVTLVAELQHRVAAAAHLLRYFDDERAGQPYRGLGEISWLLYWPEAPAGNRYWADATPAAEKLMAACIRQLEQWGAVRQAAGGELPARGVYGVPGQWPHIRALYEQAGFAHTGHTEAVYLAVVDSLRRGGGSPVPGLTVQRTVGMNGTRFSALAGQQIAGYIEVEMFGETERLSRHIGWADVGNLHVSQHYRRRGVGSWLLNQAADWLSLAQAGRLLAYAAAGSGASGRDDAGYRAFLQAAGFRELTRTQRGWTRPAG